MQPWGASYWDRNAQLPIGRLEPAVAAAAARVAFKEHGRAIEDAALQQVAQESHGCPFFPQF